MSYLSFNNTNSSIDQPVNRRRSKTTLRQQPNAKTQPKPTLENLQTQILRDHQTIQHIISNLEKVLVDKLETHETEILKVYKITMSKVMEGVQQIINKYLRLMEQARLSSQLIKIENELEYFRKESLTLFEENKVHKINLKKLKSKCYEMERINETQKLTIFHLTQKLFKSKNKIYKIKKDSQLLSDQNQKEKQYRYKTDYTKSGQHKQKKARIHANSFYYRTETSLSNNKT